MGFSVGSFGGQAAAECVSLDPKFWRAIFIYPPKKQFLAISRVFAWAGILCPLPLSNFWQFLGGGYFMSPPTQQFLAIFQKFCFAPNFLCPLTPQIFGNFWQNFGRAVVFWWACFLENYCVARFLSTRHRRLLVHQDVPQANTRARQPASRPPHESSNILECERR